MPNEAAPVRISGCDLLNMACAFTHAIWTECDYGRSKQIKAGAESGVSWGSIALYIVLSRCACVHVFSSFYGNCNVSLSISLD